MQEAMTACELLAPAGSLEKLKIAIRYGADAVYFGGRRFSLRARAGNLTRKEIEKAVIYTGKRGIKSYVALNVFARNRDVQEIKDYLLFLKDIKPDGLIISDPGMIDLVRRHVPEIPIHLSTQANTTNYQSAVFWQEQGIKRVNLARELSLEEIRQIRRKTALELEVFVHGALCISYSGRCMLSLYLTGRDANSGNCAHPCRYAYHLQEEKRPGEFLPVEEDERGLYIFNSRDLCLIKRIPELLEAGADSLKIEGRMKGIFYLATVVRVYRAALDAALGKKDNGFSAARAAWELSLISSRQYTENFIDGPPDENDMLYEGPDVLQPYIPAAVVLEGGTRPLLRANHVIRPGDELEYMHKRLAETTFRVTGLYDAKSGMQIDKTIGGELVRMECRPRILFKAYGLIRKKNILE